MVASIVRQVSSLAKTLSLAERLHRTNETVQNSSPPDREPRQAHGQELCLFGPCGMFIYLSPAAGSYSICASRFCRVASLLARVIQPM
jgi:hypothetical protein